jgi:8-oxo-dGTP pyrophosphatase MutT (NUDIX family)/phosphohistidine phosphatase SixA
VKDHTVRAAGGVLWRTGSGAEVAVVHRSRYDDWTLPKGKLDPGEHPLVAACREVVEETGIRPVAGPRLPSTSYPVEFHGTVAEKTVDYWAMRAADGDFVTNDEVDALLWLSTDDALEQVTYAHDRAVLERFAALPLPYTTIVLVRHAKAGSRERWHGDDDARPLDDTGREQARRLAQILPWYGPEAILSADKVRCIETVRPTAEALGLPIQVDDRWDEEEHADDPARAAELVRDLAAKGEPVIVCSQGGLIPDTVARLADTDGLALASTSAHKGGVWTLTFSGRRLVAADYFRPDRD